MTRLIAYINNIIKEEKSNAYPIVYLLLTLILQKIIKIFRQFSCCFKKLYTFASKHLLT
jgi:hypothetical protein